VEKNIIYSFVSGKKLGSDTLFESDFLTQMKVRVARFVKKGKPAIATHDLYNENDEILRAINAAGLKNEESDPVKIIFYPIYLSGADGLLNLNYYEAMQGSHLGVFPSYYEPWGYTPLEAGALGVPSITTDLAGFGRYFCAECMQSDTPGIYVLKRLNKSDEDVTSQLVDVMSKFANFSKEERTANKLQARKTASMADWSSFIKNYIAAHDLAVERAYK
jgi:glycogen(starch) synthase